MNERYAITLESVAGNQTALDARLKAAFKVLLRGFGLRIVEARELLPDAQESTQDASEAKDDPSIGLETQERKRRPTRSERSGQKTDKNTSAAGMRNDAE